MTDAELLAKVKSGLGITGTFQDATLQIYIDEVKAFMRSAGVPDDVIASEASVGCIMRGVADLWNYGAGNATLSDYFRYRLLQLRIVTADEKHLEKIDSYIYYSEYDELDYEAAKEFFKQYKPEVGACSAVINGDIVGRNYDWKYDERASFVVRTPAQNGRHAVLGVAAGTSKLTQQFVDSGRSSEDYEIVPFLLLDGINDEGLFCEINIVPAGDKGRTIGTNADKEDLCAIMIPRYVLDYASNITEAIALLSNRNVFAAYSDSLTEEFHFMLKDSTGRTVVIEFIENELVVIDEFIEDKPILTNLYLHEYDGTRETLTPYAMGIERQAILTDGFDSASSEIGMLNLMMSVWYSKAYSEDLYPIWYSEFNGNHSEPYGNLTKDSPPEAYEPILELVRGWFAEHKRNGKTWQTVHTSIYNLAEKKMTVIPQETGKMFSYKLGV